MVERKIVGLILAVKEDFWLNIAVSIYYPPSLRPAVFNFQSISNILAFLERPAIGAIFVLPEPLVVVFTYGEIGQSK